MTRTPLEMYERSQELVLRDLLRALDQHIHVEVNSNFGESARGTKMNLAVRSDDSGRTGRLPPRPLRESQPSGQASRLRVVRFG